MPQDIYAFDAQDIQDPGAWRWSMIMQIGNEQQHRQ